MSKKRPKTTKVSAMVNYKRCRRMYKEKELTGKDRTTPGSVAGEALHKLAAYVPEAEVRAAESVRWRSPVEIRTIAGQTLENKGHATVNAPAEPVVVKVPMSPAAVQQKRAEMVGQLYAMDDAWDADEFPESPGKHCQT